MTIPLLTLAASVAGTLAPTALRCECLTDPLAIDRTEPELSWKVREARAGLKNLRQTAYRVLVASAPEILEKDRGDLWDSGKVQSAETYGIVYAGLPLKSRQRCWWKVKVWDQDGDESSWSEPAKFRMGLLSPSDWTAKWIGIDAPDRLSPEGERFSGANWIWSKTDQQGKVPKVTRTFIRTFAADPEALESAVLNITVDDQFVLFLNGTEVARSDGQPEAWRRAHRLDLLPLLKKGENELRVDATNDGETASGVLAKLVLDRKQGSSQIIVTDESWQEPNGPGVTVIAPFTGGPWGNFGAITLRGATYYRREFRTKAKVTRATAYVTALGLVDLHVNGKRVNEALFTPGWTDYDKRVYYRSFDISAVVQEGQNCVGVVLGDGWYSGYVGFGAKRAHYGERPRVLAQIELELEDGSREIIGTDESWLASTGPTLEQDFLMGETYDARLAKPWCEASFKAEGWIRSDTHEAPKAVLQAFPAEPVLPYKELQPISIKKLPSGAYLLDFGQNLAGFLKLKLKGRRGQEITLRHGEWLNPDGTLYTTNLRAARATDLYICGGEEEEWSPRFTFHGFQYAEISGLDQEPKAGEVVAVAISSGTPETGRIETSDPLLNKLSSNAWWTQKMNFIDVPTDCPQRDERLGWTGDAQAYIRTAAMYSDVQSFFRKWLVDLDDAQRADGQYPMVAPLKVAGDDGGPAWADAGVICPWAVFEVYGDRRQLEEHYPGMKKFVDFCRKRSTPDLLPPEKFHCFGDWLNIEAETPHDVIYQAYFAGSAELLSKAAAVLGKGEEAKEYGELARRVKEAFVKAYVTPEGKVTGDTQCAYVLALGFDIVTDELAEKAAQHLVRDIEKRGWHLSTGFVGTRDLMHVLSKIGRDDVAFKLLHQATFPSWKFEILNGATSIWERWDSWTPDKGLQDPGMNSFAHYAYGAVMGWVFSNIGGISAGAPGYELIKIAPKIDPNLTWAKTSYDSVRGMIRTSWKREGNQLSLTVQIPPNTTAEITMPGQDARAQSGELVRSGVFNVGSGEHTFTSSLR